MPNYAGNIEIDLHSGRISGASPAERLVLELLRTACRALRPVDDFGLSYVARAVRKLLPSSKAMVFVIDDDCRMRTDYCDAYWSVLILPGYPYERSIHRFVTAFRDVDYGFIDGGANHGYWAIIVSGRQAGAKTTAAVEAANDTFDHLSDNHALNDARFSILNLAIAEKSGESVLVYGSKHEARSTVAQSPAEKPLPGCTSISLDDLADLDCFAGIDKFVVKLDVEGVEIPAIRAATRLASRDSVYLVEDHGSDRNHEVTRFLMGEMGMRVFWYGDNAGEIVDVSQLDAIKRSRRHGYEIIATRSAFWTDKLICHINPAMATIPAAAA